MRGNQPSHCPNPQEIWLGIGELVTPGHGFPRGYLGVEGHPKQEDMMISTVR